MIDSEEKPNEDSKENDDFTSSCWGCAYLGGCLFSVLGLILSAFGLLKFNSDEIRIPFQELFQTEIKVIAIAFSIALVISVFTFLGYVGIHGFRKPKGFISYHHSDQSTVEKICSDLSDIDLQVDYMPFQPADHDFVIQSTQEEIRRSTFLLVLPGPGGTFSDAEVYAASTLKKTIIIISTGDETRLPNTAYRGYPAFNLKCLKQEGMIPLKTFVAFSSGHWRQALISLRRGVNQSFSVLEKVFIYSLALNELIDGLFLFFPVISQRVQVYLLIINLILWIPAFAVVSFLAVRNRMIATKVVQQKIITGESTYEMLNEIFGKSEHDKTIIECLEPELVPMHI